MGGEVTGSYRFKTGFYGLGDMTNEFQRIMDRLTEKLPNIHCYPDEILIATVGRGRTQKTSYQRFKNARRRRISHKMGKMHILDS